MKHWFFFAAAMILLFLIVAAIRNAPVENYKTPASLPAQAGVVAASGIIVENEYGNSLLCLGTCVRLYGSFAPNGSMDKVIGVWQPGGMKSITVVKESWTQ